MLTYITVLNLMILSFLVGIYFPDFFTKIKENSIKKKNKKKTEYEKENSLLNKI